MAFPVGPGRRGWNAPIAGMSDDAPGGGGYAARFGPKRPREVDFIINRRVRDRLVNRIRDIEDSATDPHLHVAGVVKGRESEAVAELRRQIEAYDAAVERHERRFSQ